MSIAGLELLVRIQKMILELPGFHQEVFLGEIFQLSYRARASRAVSFETSKEVLLGQLSEPAVVDCWRLYGFLSILIEVLHFLRRF